MALQTGVILPFDVVEAPPVVPPLDVPFINKIRSKWCWAACAGMVLRFLHDRFNLITDLELLCYLAQESVHGMSGNCCNPGACNNTLKPSQIDYLWRKIKIVDENLIINPDFRKPNNHPSIDDLVKEIQVNHLPVEISFETVDTGHVIILYGCENEAGIWHFFRHDPDDPVASTITISQDVLTSTTRPDPWKHTWMRLTLVEAPG